MSRSAAGYGIATIIDGGEKDGLLLDTWFPAPVLGTLATLPATPPIDLIQIATPDISRQIRREVIKIEIELDTAPQNVSDAYLRLHLLSHRLVKPNCLSLDGIFGILNNVAWTSAGPCAVDNFEITRAKIKAATGAHVSVYGVDKFPRMVDYVIPSGVRIADADDCYARRLC
jgi:2,3,4,5-tetrahydropyridine-2-carboxylate N-succinyltransferase